MSRWFGAAAAACLVWCSGCGRYGEFTLPAAKAQAGVQWTWSAEPQPVFRPADASTRDILNPVIVRRDALLFNFYSVFDGRNWRTGTATSPDGKLWERLAVGLAPDPKSWEADYIAANGAAVWTGSEFLYWYQGGPKGGTRIGLARSPDGLTWTKEPDPVLDPGPRGSWDEISLGDPDVIRQDGIYYLFYLGQDRARRQRLGVARSRDGVRWEKLRSGPVLELGSYGAFDEVGLGEPAVWLSHGWYWMLYTGRDAAERRRMGLARSRDGVQWERTSLIIAGEQEWNQAVVCDASVLVNGDEVRVWFGGGNRPSPDENLNGAIGVGTLRATLAK